MFKTGYIYILASKKDGVLYVGVTSNLERRIYEHKEGLVDGFTKKYFVKNLVYFEECSNMESAILREKQIKGGNRENKIQLIESINPERNDLYNDLI
ncbi:GIY-YIG nuclease family protein [Candidatus Gracilibacteria bacterium]|nr:GIY-YIG nuclease family protein [Candidatus Gracilibacteria bacterium]